MSTHRFILEPYKGVSTRHTCPNCHRQRCFSKYIDTEKQIQFPEYVGRCDHEQKCGYHFTPRDYFEQNPSEKEKFTENSFRSYDPIKEAQPIATSYIDLGNHYVAILQTSYFSSYRLSLEKRKH